MRGREGEGEKLATNKKEASKPGFGMTAVKKMTPPQLILDNKFRTSQIPSALQVNLKSEKWKISNRLVAD